MKIRFPDDGTETFKMTEVQWIIFHSFAGRYLPSGVRGPLRMVRIRAAV